MNAQWTINAPLPKKNLVPLGSDHLLDIWCRVFDKIAGPQKNYRVHISFKIGQQSAAVEIANHANISLGMFVRDGAENSVPVRTTKVGRSLQRCDGILLSTDVLNDNIVHLIFLQSRGQINVDLNTVLGILLLDGMKQGVEPLGCTKVTNDPSEIHLRHYSVKLRTWAINEKPSKDEWAWICWNSYDTKWFWESFMKDNECCLAVWTYICLRSERGNTNTCSNQ